MGCATLGSPSTKQITTILNSDQEFEAQIGSNRFQIPGSISIFRDCDEKTVKTNKRSVSLKHQSITLFISFFGLILPFFRFSPK